MTRPRLAVIGAGIAGLSAAWLLRRDFDVTLFEAENRAGGHADTQIIRVNGGQIAVDTGFIVLNDRNYPNLTGLFDAIGVPTENTEMSFAASIGGGAFEYGGGSIAQMFSQRRNILRPRFWRMIRDILRFYKQAPGLLDGEDTRSLGAFLDQGGYGEAFMRDHILPMGAAIWSSPAAAMRDFPAASFARFFHNHGLLSLNDRPQWRTVTGGSRVYVQRVLEDVRADAVVRLGCPVGAIHRGETGLTIVLGGGATQRFDRAILACHADQALALLDTPSEAERRILGAVRCADNVAVLHSDESLMPRRRAVWSAWNYLSDGDDDSAPVSLTYWMNRLQNLPASPPLFVTLNPRRAPDPALVHATRYYRHPQFDAGAIAAQRALPTIQGAQLLYFAGAWTGWGFHEDGIASAVKIAEALGAAIPWRGAAQTLREAA